MSAKRPQGIHRSERCLDGIEGLQDRARIPDIAGGKRRLSSRLLDFGDGLPQRCLPPAHHRDSCAEAELDRRGPAEASPASGDQERAIL